VGATGLEPVTPSVSSGWTRPQGADATTRSQSTCSILPNFRSVARGGKELRRIAGIRGIEGRYPVRIRYRRAAAWRTPQATPTWLKLW
jgi:hypothetical protein